MTNRFDPIHSFAVHTVTPLLMLCLGAAIPSPYSMVCAQSAVPDGVEQYHVSDRERQKERLEKHFGKMDPSKPLQKRIRFSKELLRKVKWHKFSSIKPYAYDHVRELLKEHGNKPEAIELLIKTVNRQQRLHGYKQSRQDLLMELFRQLGQNTKRKNKRLNIVRRMLSNLHHDARQAVSEHNWDHALTNYRRIQELSSNFTQFFQAKPASRMVSRIKNRMEFERSTSERMQDSSSESENPSKLRTIGRNLLQLGQWSHALLFLEKANENGISTPLLDLAQIGLSNQMFPLTSPDLQFRYLTRIATIVNKVSGKVSVNRLIATGFEIYRSLQRNDDALSDQQKKQVVSVLSNWQMLMNKEGPEPVLNMGDTPPLYVLYPKDGLLLYAPGNGNAQDYSTYQHTGDVQFGALVNAGSGTLGAFQFTGAPHRHQNRIVFDKLKDKGIQNAFTVAMRFRRHRNASHENFKNVGNTMLHLGNHLQIGTNGSLIQMFFRAKHGRSSLQVEGNIKNGQWNHLALSYNPDRSNELRLYLNGSPINQWSQFEGGLHARTLILGSNNRNRSPFTGLIDDVFLYNRSLTNAEISSLYQRSGTE